MRQVAGFSGGSETVRFEDVREVTSAELTSIGETTVRLQVSMHSQVEKVVILCSIIVQTSLVCGYH